jgi:hypothetical protein
LLHSTTDRRAVAPRGLIERENRRFAARLSPRREITPPQTEARRAHPLAARQHAVLAVQYERTRGSGSVPGFLFLYLSFAARHRPGNVDGMHIFAGQRSAMPQNTAADIIFGRSTDRPARPAADATGRGSSGSDPARSMSPCAPTNCATEASSPPARRVDARTRPSRSARATGGLACELPGGVHSPDHAAVARPATAGAPRNGHTQLRNSRERGGAYLARHRCRESHHGGARRKPCVAPPDGLCPIPPLAHSESQKNVERKETDTRVVEPSRNC